MTKANQCTGERNHLFPFLIHVKSSSQSRSRLFLAFEFISYHNKYFIYFRYTLSLKWYRFWKCNFVQVYRFLQEIRCLKIITKWIGHTQTVSENIVYTCSGLVPCLLNRKKQQLKKIVPFYFAHFIVKFAFFPVKFTPFYLKFTLFQEKKSPKIHSKLPPPVAKFEFSPRHRLLILLSGSNRSARIIY